MPIFSSHGAPKTCFCCCSAAFGVSFSKPLFWSRFFSLIFSYMFVAAFASDNRPVAFWLQEGTPKTAQKLPVRQDNPKGNSQQCLSATQLARNEAEMPSDGLVRSKTRPGYAKMAPKRPENRLVLQKKMRPTPSNDSKYMFLCALRLLEHVNCHCRFCL